MKRKKIRPNSGNFKVMSEEVLGLTVGQELKTEEAIATVRDVHRHTADSGGERFPTRSSRR